MIVGVTGKDLFQPGDVEDPPVWDWDLLRGYSKEEVKETWKNITTSPYFWAMLDPMEDAPGFLTELWHRPYEVYFITNRPGVQTQAQTATFLSQFGYRLPSVVVSAEKGACCAALGVDVYLDDKGENIIDVLEKSPMTTAILKPYRHNEKFREAIVKEGGLTCSDLAGFLSWVDGYGQNKELEKSL